MHFIGKRQKTAGRLILSGVFIFGAVLGMGCRKAIVREKSPEPGLYMRTLQVGKMTRRYAYYIPKNPGNVPLPVVFELHGGGIFIEDMTGESGYKTPYKLWMTLADSEKLIVVYPEGKNGAYGKPTWNDCRANSTVSSTADDVGFIRGLIKWFSLNYSIDLQRVYVSGTSNGGLMALRLAVELPDKIAAVAAVAAAMPDSSECRAPASPMSVLFMNGTADNHLPYRGGTLSNPPNPSHGTVYSTEKSVKLWTTVDHTGSVPVVYQFPDRDMQDGSTVVRYTYSNGIKGTEVVLYKVIGGGHSAPSIQERYSRLFEAYFGRQNHDIEMVKEVWKFFKHKTVPEKTGIR
ncbi:MAG: hypothetical protein GXO76_11035 [Calditrichaeota bacterium]|nr:hypothetical protein [Calditrichota bacterium]